MILLSESNDAAPATEGLLPAINAIYGGECLSLSGRSTLTFEIGREADAQGLHMRITSNSGAGMFCDEWVTGEEIEAVVLGSSKLTAMSFQRLRPGKSINTAGFFLACLKELRFVRVNAENSRLHEHIPATTFERVALDVIEKADSARKQRSRKRQAKEE